MLTEHQNKDSTFCTELAELQWLISVWWRNSAPSVSVWDCPWPGTLTHTVLLQRRQQQHNNNSVRISVILEQWVSHDCWSRMTELITTTVDDSVCRSGPRCWCFGDFNSRPGSWSHAASDDVVVAVVAGSTTPQHLTQRGPSETTADCRPLDASIRAVVWSSRVLF